MNWSQLRFDIRQASRKIVYVLAAVAAVNAIFYAAFTRPAVAEYQRLELTTRPDFEELRNLETAVERLEGYRDGVHRAEVDLATLRDEILSTRNKRLVDVQAEIADLCDEFSIALETVSYSNQLLLEEELDRVQMVVPLEGGYANLRNFLQAVEQSEKFLLVERVALGRGRLGGRMLDLQIGLATYFMAPEHLVEAHRAAGRRRRSGR